ncbi:MAG: glutathione S-transferase family protein [Alphaproteobacteria bacterium]|nr:glutathione S-transferase family protein [Alphaproteobacteria bacterium]
MTHSIPVLYGAGYSVYVRAALMALEAKGIPYERVSVDVFADTGAPPELLALNPFGKIPAFRHGDLVLYETIAITRYVDEAFDGPALQPEDIGQRARMTQLISMADSFGYRPLVWDIYVESTLRVAEGKIPDLERIEAALPKARRYLAALNDLASEGPYLLSDEPTLADFQTAPIFGYFTMSDIGAVILEEFPKLQRWWQAVSSSAPWIAASTTDT